MKIIIAGAGEIGISLAKYLRAENHDIVLIDSEDEKLNDLSEQLDIQTIHGSAAYPSILEKAGAEDADIFLAVTGNDEVNIVSCSIAKTIFNVSKRIARISSSEYISLKYKDFLDSQSIDVIVSPEKETADKIVRTMNVSGALDMVSVLDGLVCFVGLRCKKSTPIVGKTLHEMIQITTETGFRIMAISRKLKTLNLSDDLVLKSGDDIYFSVPTKSLTQILDIFGYESVPPKDIIIFGGGRIGWNVAKLLENDDADHHVTVVEKNEERAEFLAKTLSNTLVIQGDGLDDSLTDDLNLSNYRIAISTTQSDENNILLSLLSKRSGVMRTYALIHNPLYQSLLSGLGIDTTVNSNAVMVSSILQYIRKGKVKNDYFIQSGIGEVLEIEVMKSSKITKKPLGNLDISEGIVIGGILRGKLFLPYDKDLIVRPKDIVLIFAEQGTIRDLEKLVSVGFPFF